MTLKHRIILTKARKGRRWITPCKKNEVLNLTAQGIFPFKTIATKKPFNSERIVVYANPSIAGNIMRAEDGQLYFCLGIPFYEDGIDDANWSKRLDIKTCRSNIDRLTTVRPDFTGIQCEVTDEGIVSLGEVKSGYMEQLFPDKNKYFRLNEWPHAIHTTWRDPNSPIEWMKLITEVEKKYFLATTLTADKTEDGYYDAMEWNRREKRALRLRAILYKLMMKENQKEDRDGVKVREASMLFYRVPGESISDVLTCLRETYKTTESLTDLISSGMLIGNEAYLRSIRKNIEAVLEESGKRAPGWSVGAEF